MMSLASMLNPIDDQGLPSPATTRATSESTPEPTPPAKKQKLAKDAPIYVKGEPKGQVNYPAFQNFSAQELEAMNKFRVDPGVDKIMQYPRHIPYSSDKKSFLQKTGRDAFEVFQYSFKMPNDDNDKKQYHVLWDYNIGLVRITPFFKCLNFPKTVPGKMLQQNPGLKQVCHSITGGALAAQGYWMPYNAAKAIAATFCYHLRFALLPLFGPDFARQCAVPGSERFGNMIIDRAIIEACTRGSSSFASPSPAPSFSTLSSATQFTQPRYDIASPRSVNRPVDYPRRRWVTPSKQQLERRNGMFTPAQSRNQLSPRSDTGLLVNTKIPRSHPAASVQQAHAAPSAETLLASQTLIDACSAPPNSPTLPQMEEEQDDDDADISPKTITRRPGAAGAGAGAMVAAVANMLDAETEDGNDSVCSSSGGRIAGANVGAEEDTEESRAADLKAAWMLLQLHMADASMRDQNQNVPEASAAPRRGRKRRASA